MYNSVEIQKNIYWVGINDKRLELFENLWPLEHGVSYNSYLICDEKVALIDTVAEGNYEYYLKKIQSIIKDRKIDYLIVNHMEPDHSGVIPTLVRNFPDIKIVGNSKTLDILKNFYSLEDNFHLVKEGDELALGNYKLKFYPIPMVHWPESMVAYEETTKTLFSNDAFGSFGSLDGGIFDDQLDLVFFEDEMRRYYSNIVGKYGVPVQNALKKLSSLEIKCICPSHGPICRTNPQKVISLYDKWSLCESDKGVVIVYGSMYGNTAKMAETIGQSLAKHGIEDVKIYDSSKTHLSYILRDIWKYRGLIIGSCAYNNGMFPPIENLTTKLLQLGVKNRLLALFGSYSWNGGGVSNLQKFAEKSGMELVGQSIEVKSTPKEEDLEKLRELGKLIAKKLQS